MRGSKLRKSNASTASNTRRSRSRTNSTVVEAVSSTSSGRVLQVLPVSEAAKTFYEHHRTFHEGDSGLDLFVLEDQLIRAGETSFLPLGIKCAAYDEQSNNVSWLVMPRSSISKTPLRLANSVGLIDAGYRGEIVACLDNIKTFDYTVKRGDRLTQAVFADLKPFKLQIVSELSATERGESGFGSTSLNSSEVQQTSVISFSTAAPATVEPQQQQQNHIEAAAAAATVNGSEDLQFSNPGEEENEKPRDEAAADQEIDSNKKRVAVDEVEESEQNKRPRSAEGSVLPIAAGAEGESVMATATVV